MSRNERAARGAEREHVELPGLRRAAWIVFAVACAVYANSLANGYTLDDVPIVRENPLVTNGRRSGG